MVETLCSLLRPKRQPQAGTAYEWPDVSAPEAMSELKIELEQPEGAMRDLTRAAYVR
jgi:hypothetical protein